MLKAGNDKQDESSHDSIHIRAFDPPPPSPHIVNLRKESGMSRIAIDPYVEAPSSAAARATMNFAAAVRDAVREPPSPTSPSRLSALEAHTDSGQAPLRKPRVMPAIGAFFKAFPYAPRVAVLVLLLAIPLPSVAYYRHLLESGRQAVKESTAGFLALQTSTVAAFHSDIQRAETELTRALGAFAQARRILDNEHAWLRAAVEHIPLIGDGIESRERLLASGEHIALGNTYLLKGVEAVHAASEKPLTERLRILGPHMVGARAEYRAASLALARVRTAAIPVEHQQLFEDFRLAFTALGDDVEDVSELLGTLDVVFGGDSFRRYLIVFQNPHELRPTGGFLGSYAILDIQKGKVLRWEIPPGGTYDLQGQLTAYVKPPAPLQLVNSRWEFQDANWFPDFSASAAKIAWFYERGRGTTVDGVIAVNAPILERLLRIVGPVNLYSRQIELDAETAIAALQTEVENGAEKASDRPKAVLADAAEELFTKLAAPTPLDALRLLVELHDALDEKDIQVYFTDPRGEDVARQYGWSGEMLTTAPPQDYIAVIHTNLQGQKSDAKILQAVEHQTVVESDGSVVDTVVIRRTHGGSPGEAFYGAPNWSYVRAYVPEGAELLDAGGFQFPPEDAFHAPESWYEDDATVARLELEDGMHDKTGTRITREFGKTAFGNWVLTLPGETSVIFFTYRLPFSVLTGEQLSRYELVAQKQSGAAGTFSSSVIYPEGWTPIWKSDDAMDLALNGASVVVPFDRDRVFGLILKAVEP